MKTCPNEDEIEWVILHTSWEIYKDIFVAIVKHWLLDMFRLSRLPVIFAYEVLRVAIDKCMPVVEVCCVFLWFVFHKPSFQQPKSFCDFLELTVYEYIIWCMSFFVIRHYQTSLP